MLPVSIWFSYTCLDLTLSFVPKVKPVVRHWRLVTIAFVTFLIVSFENASVCHLFIFWYLNYWGYLQNDLKVDIQLFTSSHPVKSPKMRGPILLGMEYLLFMLNLKSQSVKCLDTHLYGCCWSFILQCDINSVWYIMWRLGILLKR